MERFRLCGVQSYSQEDRRLIPGESATKAGSAGEGGQKTLATGPFHYICKQIQAAGRGLLWVHCFPLETPSAVALWLKHWRTSGLRVSCWARAPVMSRESSSPEHRRNLTQAACCPAQARCRAGWGQRHPAQCITYSSTDWGAGCPW